MKILMIGVTFPYPPSRGGTQNRTFSLLQYLSEKHQITLVTQRQPDVTDQQIKELRSYLEDLVIFPTPQSVNTNKLAKVARFIRAWIVGIPPNVTCLYDPKIQTWIDDQIKQQKFEVITAEHSVNSVYIRSKWRQKLTTVINIHSSLYKTCQNQLETETAENPWRDRLYLPLLRRYEKAILAKCSQVVVTTPEDQIQMHQFNSQAKITLVPNGVDLQIFPPREQDPGGYRLVFVGGLDYIVNIDAVCFFSREVFPLLQKEFPEITWQIVGANPAPEVKDLANLPGIEVTGRVPSVVTYLHQATVAIVPLRTGFGMKIKTLEYMAAGIPVVGSDRGLEGLKIENPLVALRANNVPEYLEAIGRLFRDACLRQTLSDNARKMIEESYTWASASEKYEKVLTKGEL